MNNKSINQKAYLFYALLKKIPIAMRITLLLLFVLTFQLQAEHIYSQDTKISLNLKHSTIEKVLQTIEEKSDYYFLYNNRLINVDRKVSVRVRNAAISAVLEKLFKSENVNYEVKGTQIILSPKEMYSQLTAVVEALQQQKKTITGTIIDAAGVPVIGANIVETGTTNGTVTDIDGNFTLEVANNATIRVSYIGYLEQEIATAGQYRISVTLQEDTKTLEEIVVTALGIKKDEKALGYSVQKIDSEVFTTVKGENISTSLTGKVAGLIVRNTTEFFVPSSVKLRGADALIVVNGVPTSSMSLDDISPDDIADISVLKGATASALYGNRGSNGAIMITTKNKNMESQFSVQVNSNTMISAGYLKIPETQKSYGTGVGNQPVYNGQFVWGPRLDIGTTAMQVDPETGLMKEMPLVSKGTNNLRNFLEESLVTNNNISVTQTTQNATIRGSFSHVYNKGEAPNTRANRYIFNLSGNINLSDKFTLDASWNYSKRETNNQPNFGYGRSGSYIYLLTIWNGPDFDIREWKDYWMIKDKKQKYYQTGWYDNPYFLQYEVLNPHSIDVNTGQITANYSILPEMKILLRSGVNTYNDKYSQRQAISFNRNGKGYFRTGQNYTIDLNNDLLLTYYKNFGHFGIDAWGGGSVNYYQFRDINANTNNGLSIPAFYSLSASIGPVSASSAFQKKQVNSAYGKLSLSYDNAFYLDLTGRNDWSSTLPATTRSYFYPSAAFSALLSEVINMPDFINFWKLRASWTVSKQDLGIFDLNQAYEVNTNVWNNMNTQSFPSIIRGEEVKPQTSSVYELGTNLRFFDNRLNFDYSFFSRLQYNLLMKTPISGATGYNYKQTNTEEEWLQKGMEVTLKGVPVKQNNLVWNVMLNWAYNHWYYHKLDPIHSDEKTYIGVGKRIDVVRTRDWERDPQNNIVIGSDGYPVKGNFFSENIGLKDPDWFWGLTNSIELKNWSFYMTFDGRVGGLTYSDTEYGLWAAGSHPDSDNNFRYQEVVNGKTEYVGNGVKVVSGELVRDGSGRVVSDTRIFKKNDTKVPYTSFMEAWSGYGSDDGGNPRVKPREFYFSETFVKLRELAVNYNLPPNFISKVGLKNASIGVVGQNLLIWTKGFRFDDPDSGSGNLPSPSQRFVGVNLKFGF